MPYSVNSSSTAQIDYTAGTSSPANTLFHIKSAGLWNITANIRVTNSAAQNRQTFYLTLIMYTGQNNTSTRGSLFYRYPFGTSMYIRDDAANYDSGQMGGQIQLILSAAQITAGVQVEVVSFRMDSEQTGGSVPIDTATSSIMFQQIKYSVS